MLPKSFEPVYEILEQIEKNGEVAYIVGGAVRNYLLSKSINDIDITTSATPTQIATFFPNVVDIASEHGTVLVIHHKIPYEITTFRGTKNTLEDDLMYRDFTMNAIAMNKNGDIIDVYGGTTHLNEKRIVAVQHATDRIKEDPLRIIRAVRFVSELQFSIDDTLANVMKHEAFRLEQVATERILQEWTKLIKGHSIQLAWKCIEATQIALYLPLFKEKPTLMNELATMTEPFNGLAEFVAYMCIRNDTFDLQQWIKKWKMSNEVKNDANKLLLYYNHYQLHGIDDMLIYDVEEPLITPFIQLLQKVTENLSANMLRQKWMEKRDALPIKSRSTLVVTGHDIMELFPEKRTGKWIGDLLREVEVAVVRGHLPNEKIILKEWIQCHPPVND
ncbi:CCA tRNA nucleotidyltransferase [Pseudogracilibacillus sp. ICA-222130]|uniref:CCA tRNA nucleotidyltransferase n=1 Tax=Pseudogracilibacillus sp. ICA-222130 TaxID=3134655 RepID=UPI0030BC6EAE